MVIANQLFDALTAANVPRDQAHAVVDALEHRMTSELATKADLSREVAELRTATKADIAELRTATKADLAALRAETKADLAALRAEVKIDIAKLDAKISDLQLNLTVRMGGMMLGTAGLLFTALKYFGV